MSPTGELTAAAPARPARRRTRREGPLRALKSVLEIIVIAFFFTTFIAQPFQIPSSSMVPTLRVGDFILVDKQTFAPGTGHYGVLPKSSVQRGDLLVFHWPVDPTLHLVKRVIGVPGDRIRLRHGRVFIHGQPLPEPYAFYTRSRPNSFRDEFPSLREADPNMEPGWWIQLRRTIADGEVTVPPNQYFVLGDNRNDSEDSRYWGFVPREAIVGRPLVVYFAVRRSPPPTGSFLHRLRSALSYGFASERILR
jgi:signal peptidase I